MTLSPGRYYTLIAALLITATGFALQRTATAALPAARPAIFAGVVLGVGLLLIGSARWITLATVPMLAAILLEAKFGDDPSWVRSIVIGCLWFVALEVSWEAIGRRSGATYTRAAGMVRVQEVGTVVAVSLGLGFVAAAATDLAPARSVLLQAVVLGTLLASFVVAVRTTAARAATSVRTD